MASLPTTHPTNSQAPTTRLRRAFSWFLTTFTDYDKLTVASDDELLAVVARLRAEWNFMFFVLLGIIALDVAVFAFTPDSAFPVYADARWAVAWSVFVAVVGILCDLCLVCWFIVDAGTFKTRALDFEGSYVTFSLKSRVPALCAIISSSFLGVFVALTVFRGQIVGIAIIMVAVFIFTTMSYWIHGIRRSLSGIVRGSRAAWQRIACFF